MLAYKLSNINHSLLLLLLSLFRHTHYSSLMHITFTSHTFITHNTSLSSIASLISPSFPSIITHSLISHLSLSSSLSSSHSHITHLISTITHHSSHITHHISAITLPSAHPPVPVPRPTCPRGPTPPPPRWAVRWTCTRLHTTPQVGAKEEANVRGSSERVE